MLEESSQRFRFLFLLKFTEEMIKNSKDIEIIRLREMLHGVKTPFKEEEKKISIKEEVKKKLEEKRNMPRANLRRDPFYASPFFISENYTVAPSYQTASQPQNNFQPSPSSLPNTPQPPQSMQPPQFIPPSRPSTILSKSVPVLRVPKQRYTVDPRKFFQPEPPLPDTVSDIRPVANPGVLVDMMNLNPFVNDRNVRSIEVSGEDETVYVEGSMGRKPTNVVLSREEIEGIIDNFSKEAKIPKNDGLFKVVVGNLMLTAMVSNSVSSRFIVKKLS